MKPAGDAGRRRLVTVIVCILVASVVLAVVWSIARHMRLAYPVGRDTVAVFGDGRFQIGRVPGVRVLHDGKTQATVLYDVRAWREVGGKVLAVDGQGTIAVVDLATGSYQRFAAADPLPAELRENCDSLRRKLR